MSTEDASQPSVSTEIILRIGPLFVGTVLSWALFGVSVVQLYIYYVSFTSERLLITCSVYAILILDILHSIIVTAVGWQVLCQGWGRMEVLDNPGWAFPWTPIVTGIVALLVQTFYAWRINKLGGWRVIPVIIVAVGITQLTGAWVIGISLAKAENITILHNHSLSVSNIVWLGGSATADIIIMLSMLYLLYGAKKRTQEIQSSSEIIVQRLIRFTLESGLACALTACLELTLFLVLPNTNVHLCIASMLAKVYSNSFMASLNSRARIFAQRTSSDDQPSIVTRIDFRMSDLPTMNGGAHSRGNTPVEIHISRMIETDGVNTGKCDSAPQIWDNSHDASIENA